MYLNGVNRVPFNDIWRHSGLGKAKHKVWTILQQREEWKVSELAQQLGVGSHQTRHQLKELAEHGLAQKVAKGLWKGVRMSMSEGKQLAEKLGVSEASRRQHDRHLSERRRFRDSHGTFPIPFGKYLNALKAESGGKNEVSDEAAA